MLTRPELGAFFLFGNIIIAAIVILNWDFMLQKNRLAVDIEYDNEARLLEILHNFDKIIYRGQTEQESRAFGEKSTEAFEKALDFQTTLENYGLFINMIVTALVAIIVLIPSRSKPAVLFLALSALFTSSITGLRVFSAILATRRSSSLMPTWASATTKITS
jgi:hypothetical protein